MQVSFLYPPQKSIASLFKKPLQALSSIRIYDIKIQARRLNKIVMLAEL